MDACTARHRLLSNRPTGLMIDIWSHMLTISKGSGAMLAPRVVSRVMKDDRGAMGKLSTKDVPTAEVLQN